ncbi:30S ribosomal protein S17 [Metamycoplasma cloacale]|uniref:Small ribosomal subunit protein uS17 n=1 Tax=Metamycoplasma cloacale TaxID=92401 RepID=A0A2Z4LLV4_9BACT|nr:30S ribosomal protein S17 [Metamycoplasma cloacale]AWX42706.1 30S ribosomal protein S17 [Metamycoplasma cloacale]VEU79482.1 30S ribosomal protein S17 [Metamycoplasma cloacale]
MEAQIRENHRKTLVGTVVSTKNNKTITVLVETYEKHPLYSKRFKKSKKFAVHDERNEAKVGDFVKIQETRPLSKTKHFRLVEIKSHAVEAIEEVELNA